MAFKPGHYDSGTRCIVNGVGQVEKSQGYFCAIIFKAGADPNWGLLHDDAAAVRGGEGR